MAPSPITGRCLCGNVTFSVEGDAAVHAACHCTDCQRQTGNPFSVVVGVPRDGFSVQGSTLSSYSTIGTDHGGETERNFCSACGSPLFSLAAAMPEMVFIKAGALDDASWVQPSIEVWTSSAQPWAPHFEGAGQLDRGPG
jgi:hypothetical protein